MVLNELGGLLENYEINTGKENFILFDNKKKNMNETYEKKVEFNV